MKGTDIIESLNVKDCNSVEAMQAVINVSHMGMLELHARVIACHCECLGMNSANFAATIANEIAPYNEIDYRRVMIKWGISNEEGEPTI